MTKYNKELENSKYKIKFLLFFERIYGYIEYLAKKDNTVLVVSRKGYAIYQILNKQFYFNYYCTKRNPNYDKSLKVVKERFK